MLMCLRAGIGGGSGGVTQLAAAGSRWTHDLISTHFLHLAHHILKTLSLSQVLVCYKYLEKIENKFSRCLFLRQAGLSNASNDLIPSHPHLLQEKIQEVKSTH